jgi:hypothetical protein
MKTTHESMLGKSLPFSKTFEGGDFDGFYAAEEWCKAHSISVGTMQREAPIGLMAGDFAIAKWRNLSVEDIRGLDGVLIGESKRDGPVTVLLSFIPAVTLQGRSLIKQ